MNADQIFTIQPGVMLERTWDTFDGQALPDARWGKPRKVVSVTAPQQDSRGKWFCCFYIEFGPYSHMSGSIKEGESHYRFAE